jgi:hypothetical protein
MYNIAQQTFHVSHVTLSCLFAFCSIVKPQVRMVALLREPVSRALSSVNMLFQRSPEYAHLQPGTHQYTSAWQAYVTTELRR